jgi:hypothetical protein
MNKLYFFIWPALSLLSSTANALSYPIYSCNLPCSSIENYAQVIAVSGTSSNTFAIFKADTGYFELFETKKNIINTGGYLVEAKKRSDLGFTKEFKQYYAGVIADTRLSIQLPEIDPENIYRPMPSVDILLDAPQQADFIELSLARNELVRQQATFVRSILSKSVKHANTIMFRVTAVINDGSVTDFKAVAVFNNGEPTIELFHLNNSTQLYEDYLHQ